MHEDSPLIEAIALWEKITGVAPPNADGFWSKGGGMDTWAIRDTYTALKEALDLDPSEVTATLLLGKFLEEYLKQATASMASLLDAPEEHLEQLANARALRKIINAPEIVQARDSFILGLKAALARYGAGDRADVQKILANHAFVAVLRRDALRSLENLRVDQFLEGAAEEPDVRPVFVNIVHRWWNMNSLLRTMTSTPSGVSLNLIRDPNAYESYFAFAIRNGSNLFVLSDVPDHAHPLAASMARKPGRALDERASRNWFPYDLLDMGVDHKGNSIERQWSEESAIALYQPDLIPLKKISELGPAETIWVTMMLDLIVNKFWKRGYRAKQLSYTGEMIKVAPALLEHARRAGLPALIDKPLEVKELTIADIVSDAVLEEHVGEKFDQPHRWLEDRYIAQVPDNMINLIAPPGGAKLGLEHKTGAIRPLSKKEVEPFFRDEITAARILTPLHQLSSARFGTPAELEADRRFLARHNVSEHIDRLAREEYEQRHAEVKKWYIAAAKKNLPTLLRWAANGGDIWVDNGVHPGASWHHTADYGMARETAVEKKKKSESWLDSSFDSDLEKRLSHTFMRTHDLREKVDLYASVARNVGHNLGGDHYAITSRGRARYDGMACAVTEAKASYAAIFYPVCPEELATIAGCEVTGLPDVLQHWSKYDRYRGNSILGRIDPMVWNVHNPWLKLEFRVRIPLSFSGKARIEKAGAALPSLPVITKEDAYSQQPAPTILMIGGKR